MPRTVVIEDCPMCGGSGKMPIVYGKRAHGQGSLYLAASNLRWIAAVQRDGRRRSRSSKSRARAEEMLKDLLTEDW